MMKEQVMNAVALLNEDDVIIDMLFGMLDITFVDFVEFGENWSEVYRDYTDENAIDEFLTFLSKNCESSVTDGLYNQYTFADGFQVQVGYTSFDI